jgi:acylphosphatase
MQLRHSACVLLSLYRENVARVVGDTAVVRQRVIVHGSVQGVGFRVSIARAAKTRRLSGWVRNCDDGTVEAVFEGDGEGVDALVRYCEYGSSGASVSHVVAVAEAPEGLSGFEIR